MNQAEIISWITEIEKGSQVERLTYEGHLIWPLLRLLLFSPPASPPPSAGRSVGKLLKVWKNRNAVRNWVRSASRHQSPGRLSVLYLEQTSKWTTIDGKVFHRFFDPIRNCADSATAIKLVWQDSSPPLSAKDHSSINLLEAVRLATEYADLRTRSDHSLPGNIVQVLEEWSALSGRNIDQLAVKSSLDTYLSLFQIFWRAFGDRDHLVFLTCFYSLPSFALVAAIQKVGGTAVEVQHGQQGGSHPMYTNWTQTTGCQYGMMPAVFCMWGQSGVDRIMEWGKKLHVTAVESGNTWLGYSLENRQPTELGFSKKRRVLISMQYTELSEFIWQTVGEMENTEWVFRIHPRFQNDLGAFREECGQRLGIESNWRIDTGEDDFYTVIQTADIHLTGWSTTAFEALYFGVPTILIHPNGLTSMKNEVLSGIFAYADSMETLRSNILSPPEVEIPENSMRADLAYSKDVFSRLTNGWRPVVV